MTAPGRLSLALGLALAIPATAYAYDGGPSPSHHDYRRPHHGMVAYPAPTATAASVPSVGFWPPSYATSQEQYEIEGLTRNPDDCVIYGCVGNN